MCGPDVGRWGEGGSKVYAAQMITMKMMMFNFLFLQRTIKRHHHLISVWVVYRGVCNC